ncbi:soma ferritin-like [Coccinella septempunctata]|uniref:soma ferritin-like n=1 Tax=Coccinella septempunctata TaxID=41139 RepID=UPI001D08EB93|nr:soma ferritin-like [Coccinella septempunctata]
MGFLGRVLFRINSREILPNHLRNVPIKQRKFILSNNKDSGRNNSSLDSVGSGKIGKNDFFRIKYSTCKSNMNQNKIGRHQYHEDIEKAMNQQILTEFNASYSYLSMSAYFGRTDIALPGCQGFFYNMYLEEVEHAVVFMNYQLMRGGQVILFGIEAPEKDWGSIDKAFEAGLRLEETVKEKICSLVEEAEKHHDHQLVDFLTSEYLKEQNECIQEMGRFVTRAKKMVKDPNGEFLFDRQLFLNYVKDKNLMFRSNLPDKDDKNYK